jgi:pyruvate formate lyase activating enzyme
MTAIGTIFDIKKFAIHDGPGIRTTVFLKGCPLDCQWCHNPEGKDPEPESYSPTKDHTGSPGGKLPQTVVIGYSISATDLTAEITKDVIFYDQSGGGVTYSGGEPMMQPDFLLASLRECRAHGIDTALDTSGYAPWDDFERVRGLVDLFLYDLKIMHNGAHVEHTGVSNAPILENLVRLSEKNENVMPRIPIIPGITDSCENLEAVADFLAPLKNISEVALLPYNRLGEDKCRRFNRPIGPRRFPALREAQLDDRAEIFRSRGFKVRFGG